MRLSGPLLVMAAFGCANAGAQTATIFNRTGSGARAAGMANAFIAVSDDGTAASWNPAGLAQLRMPELSVVSSTTGQAVGSQGFRTRDDLSVYSPIHSTYTTTYLDFASVAVPVTIAHKPVTFQAAWRRLYTLDFRENASTTRSPLRPEGPPPLLIEGNSDVVGGFALLSMAGAVKLTSHLALGGSFNLWHGDWTETNSASETPLEGPGSSTFGTTRAVNHVRSHNLSLGLMLTYPRWSIGLLRHGEARGDFTSVGTARRSSGPAAAESFGGKVVLPQNVGLGVAFRPASRWTVAFDLTWDDWTNTVLHVTNGPTIDLFNGLPPDLSGTRDTFSANLGAECLFHGDGFVIPVRFGAAWEPQGPRDPYTLDPVNFVTLAAGGGYNTNSLKFDAAFQYRWSSFRDGGGFGIDGSDPFLPEALGERTVKEWRLKVSVIVRVTDREKFRRTVRKVFRGG